LSVKIRGLLLIPWNVDCLWKNLSLRSNAWRRGDNGELF